ncbi:MAG: PAS domain S-box protein [Gemmatimonadota bacterium]|nr:PAS domain S-box protein [Gemmatimonadota bacterium]
MQDTSLESNRPHARGAAEDRAGARAAAYCALVAGLILLFLVVRRSDWTASGELRAMLQLSAALVALVVGILALIRHYSRRNDTLLLIGAGMVGTAVLDGHHLLVTARVPFGLLPEDPAVTEPWSWFAGRAFLSLLLLWSWRAWRHERSGRPPLSDLRVYVEVGTFALLSIVLFDGVELPPAIRSSAFLARPFEVLPGVLFAAATIGYLQKGNWRRRPFEVWLVPALIISTAVQFLFVSFSLSGLDAFGTISLALKVVSYVFVFVGLVASMHELYRRVERSAHLIRHKNEALEIEIGVRRKAEQAARESESRYRRIMETIQEGYFEVDLAGNFVFWNDSLADLLGYPSDRLEGLNYRAYTREGHAAQVFETFAEVYRTGRPARVFGWEIVRPDGSLRYAEASAGPIDDERGEIVGFRGIVRDVTDRRATEERLEERTRELARSNEELRQFAYVASHDLQEPLRMVSGYTRLLARRYEGRLDEEADLFLRYAVEGVDRMQRLIRDLLDYSRVHTHGRSFERMKLEDALAWALANLEGAISDLDARITHDELPVVRADRSQLGQLFQNLLANALKFRGDRRPEIHVGVQGRPEVWQVSVRDNGIGIDPEHRTRVFEIFQRLHAPDEFEGTGIGLAICKRIVDRHGGQIWIEPSPGQGSTFVFTLPRDAGRGRRAGTVREASERQEAAGRQNTTGGVADPSIDAAGATSGARVGTDLAVSEPGTSS